MTSAATIIETLGLAPHPEGGWYHETWRAPAPDGSRASATAIHFLLEQGQSSHWHRVDATEIWFWHAGDPLELSLSESDDGPVTSITLGADVVGGQSVQHVIAPHWWQAARPVPGENGYALVSCVVSPAFQFDGFELAPADWQPGA